MENKTLRARPEARMTPYQRRPPNMNPIQTMASSMGLADTRRQIRVDLDNYFLVIWGVQRLGGLCSGFLPAWFLWRCRWMWASFLLPPCLHMWSDRSNCSESVPALPTGARAASSRRQASERERVCVALLFLTRCPRGQQRFSKHPSERGGWAAENRVRFGKAGINTTRCSDTSGSCSDAGAQIDAQIGVRAVCWAGFFPFGL